MLHESDLAELRQLLTGLQDNGLATPAILRNPLTFQESVGGIAAGTTFPVGTAHDVIFERLGNLPAPTAPAEVRNPAGTVRKSRTPQEDKDGQPAANKAGKAKTKEAIQVIGVTVGGISDGDLIPANITLYQLMKRIFQKRS